MLGLWIALGIVGLLLIIGIVAYNRFVRQRQQIKDAFANIETELRRRYDLIPNLVEAVKGYASHERATFEEVTRARAEAISATGSPAEQARAEGVLVEALRRLFAVAEAYPQLRATENFQQLQAELAGTENRIQGTRQVYNTQVADYNTRVKQFPSNIIASMFRFQEEEFFEIEEATRPEVVEAPRVDFTGTREGEPPAGGTAPPTAGGTTPPPA